MKTSKLIKQAEELLAKCENQSMSRINGPQGYNTKLLWRGCQIISIDDVMCIFEEIEE